MAVECFLKFEGPEIKGEAKGLPDQIDVLAWSWGASQSGTMHVGTGGGAGKANVSDLSITKWVDKGPANLMQAVISGNQFGKATLPCRRGGGDAAVPYLVIEMEKVIITSHTLGGSGGQDQFTENLSLNFAQYTKTYTPQKDDGPADAAVGPVGWKIRENVTT